MSNLIINDLPVDNALDQYTMARIKGGNSATATANGLAFATGANPFTDANTHAFTITGPGFSGAVATASAVAFSYEQPFDSGQDAYALYAHWLLSKL